MAIFQEFITTREAGEITGYHPDYIAALIRSGKVQGKRENRNWFVNKNDLQKHLMSKHYVPASTLVSSMNKWILVLGVTVVIVFCAFGLTVYFNSAALEKTKAAIQEVKKDLTDKVEPSSATFIQIDQ